MSRKPVTRVLVLLALAASALAITAAPAGAGLGIACPTPTSQPFLPWGDPASYAYAPNGGFEAGSAGWTLAGGAQVVAGNESFQVAGAGDGHSLSLPAGSSATSPPMCVSLLSGHMRLFVANGGSSSSQLKVQVLYRGGVGALLGLFDCAYLQSGAAWQPSAEVPMLGGQLPLLTQYVQFRFAPADVSGAWRIDDVYLDPFRLG